MTRIYIDISAYWPRDLDEDYLSVYAIHKTLEGTANEVSRHTLTRARDGLLEKADVANLRALSRLCSQWSGKQVTIDELIREG